MKNVIIILLAMLMAMSCQMQVPQKKGAYQKKTTVTVTPKPELKHFFEIDEELEELLEGLTWKPYEK